MKNLINALHADASIVDISAIERNAFGFDLMVKAAWAAIDEPRVLGKDVNGTNLVSQNRPLSDRKLRLLRLIGQKFPRDQ